MAVADTTVTPGRDGDRAFFGHPMGLGYLATMESFERFSFYGMQALLVLYMTTQLLQPGHIEGVLGFGPFRGAVERVFGPLSPQAMASTVFGLYAGFCSFTPVFGGLIGDRWLGQRMAVLVGGLMMAAGHFLMAFEASFLVALLLLMTGCGMLKGNISAQVGNLYAEADRRREGAFQLFYLFANVGVFGAPFVCGTLGELVGWHWGFGAAGVGMLVSLAIYAVGWSRLPPDTLPARGAPAAERTKVTRDDIPKLAAMSGLLVVVALFWVCNGDVLNTYILWAKANLDLRVGPAAIPVTWLQSLSAVVGITMAPVLIRLWDAQAARGREPNGLRKMAIGCGLGAAAWAWLALSAALAGDGKVALLAAVAFQFVMQVGYLFVYPIGMALFSKTAPPAINALMIGVYFLSVFAGSLLVGWVGQFYERLDAPAFFLVHTASAVAAGAILVLLWRPLNRALAV